MRPLCMASDERSLPSAECAVASTTIMTSLSGGTAPSNPATLTSAELRVEAQPERSSIPKMSARVAPERFVTASDLLEIGA